MQSREVAILLMGTNSLMSEGTLGMGSARAYREAVMIGMNRRDRSMDESGEVGSTMAAVMRKRLVQARYAVGSISADGARDIPGVSAQKQERGNEEIHGNRGVAGLHFRYA